MKETLAPYQIEKYCDGWVIIDTRIINESNKIFRQHTTKRSAEDMRNKLNSRHGLDIIGI